MSALTDRPITRSRGRLAPRIPRESSALPIVVVLLSLMVAVAVCFGSVLVMVRIWRWLGVVP